jgi:hypothetical protein
LLTSTTAASAQRAQTAEVHDLGPEMTAYMGFIASEEAELTALYQGGEVPPADYRVSLDRLVVTRQAALRIARDRNDDVVPDLYILRESELTQVLQNGIDALKGVKPGDRISADWVYHGKIRRGSVFYILERTGGISHAPAG